MAAIRPVRTISVNNKKRNINIDDNWGPITGLTAGITGILECEARPQMQLLFSPQRKCSQSEMHYPSAGFFLVPPLNLYARECTLFSLINISISARVPASALNGMTALFFIKLTRYYYSQMNIHPRFTKENK